MRSSIRASRSTLTKLTLHTSARRSRKLMKLHSCSSSSSRCSLLAKSKRIGSKWRHPSGAGWRKRLQSESARSSSSKKQQLQPHNYEHSKRLLSRKLNAKGSNKLWLLQKLLRGNDRGNLLWSRKGSEWSSRRGFEWSKWKKLQLNLRNRKLLKSSVDSSKRMQRTSAKLSSLGSKS